MKILKMEAGRDFVTLYTDGDGTVTVTEMTAVIGLSAPRVLSKTVTNAENGRILLPRMGKEQALMDHAIHPDFDWNYPNAFISAFNMETEEGMGYFSAFLGEELF